MYHIQHNLWQPISTDLGGLFPFTAPSQSLAGFTHIRSLIYRRDEKELWLLSSERRGSPSLLFSASLGGASQAASMRMSLHLRCSTPFEKACSLVVLKDSLCAWVALPLRRGELWRFYTNNSWQRVYRLSSSPFDYQSVLRGGLVVHPAAQKLLAVTGATRAEPGASLLVWSLNVGLALEKRFFRRK